MRHVSKIDSASCLLWIPASTSRCPYFSDTSLLPPCSWSTDQNRHCAAHLTWEPTLGSHNPLNPAHSLKACGITTLHQHAPPKPHFLHTQSYICLQSRLIHPLSVNLPLDFWGFFCLPHLNPSLALCHVLYPPFFSFFRLEIRPWNTVCMQTFQPAVSANTQLLRPRTKCCSEEFGSRRACEATANTEREKSGAVSLLKPLSVVRRRGRTSCRTPPLSHASTS